MTSYILAFWAMFFLDLVWRFYTEAAVKGRDLATANYATLIQVFSALVVIGYTENRWLLIPVALGAWAGTYVGCLLAKRGEREDDPNVN